ncbi:bifunctional transcriptional activator/DNA repair enzyme AdaA [Gloeobacter kilaueensis]|uniref:AraC family transcriptional regulator n=1 Tax=Gloeobacter kilaueensis (strain ATCC BAA-2537 / CCAP 1431/1 / ULC 316 / JS1) TaxID=1183438 RepID=U5QL90_GLOK1|nr:Ada metal-binding domain-containing protein [Gloeobacter kilaueensis]AGY59653.1 AraC family transcriptional regulator [Gloeobacter kilaueensis JS1]
MSTDETFLYDCCLARDRRYDGQFVVGVLTTGIFCLPSCSARKPKRENVRFYSDIEQARAAGLRPCKRCRPELFYRGDDPDRRCFESLAGRVRSNPAAFRNVSALAAAAQISTTKLGELFRQHAKLTPAAFLKQARIQKACELLIATGERIVDIAFAVGFESESAFHRHFVALTGCTPGAYRSSPLPLQETSDVLSGRNL